jgi:hypothetical protein
MLTPQFAAIAPSFIPWLLFACCMLILTIMPVAVICSVLSLAGEKGSVSSIVCVARFRTRVFLTAVLSFVLAQDRYTSVLSSDILRTAIAIVSSRRRVADLVIGQNYHGPVTRSLNSLDRCFELRSCTGQQERFVKWRPPDRDRHCRFSPIQ